jgi:hypothetical protein
MEDYPAEGPRVSDDEWEKDLTRLLDASREAIRKFQREHGDEEVCYFAYDSDPQYGYVLICFNTTEASRRSVASSYADSVARRVKNLRQPAFLDSALYMAESTAELPFCNNTGDFEYQGFAEVKFEHWEQQAPEADIEDDHDNPLLNRVAWLLSRAIDTLADEDAFDSLKLASPTLLGFTFHESEQHVLRMLRLPNGGPAAG